MKDPEDQQTVDWVDGSISKTMSCMFDTLVKFMHSAVNDSGRKSRQCYEEITGVSKRCAQRQLNALVRCGYLIHDNETPRGYFPTEKAKQMFGGAK